MIGLLITKIKLNNVKASENEHPEREELSDKLKKEIFSLHVLFQIAMCAPSRRSKFSRKRLNSETRRLDL